MYVCLKTFFMTAATYLPNQVTISMFNMMIYCACLVLFPIVTSLKFTELDSSAHNPVNTKHFLVSKWNWYAVWYNSSTAYSSVIDKIRGSVWLKGHVTLIYHCGVSLHSKCSMTSIRALPFLFHLSNSLCSLSLLPHPPSRRPKQALPALLPLNWLRGRGPPASARLRWPYLMWGRLSLSQRRGGMMTR